MKKMQTQVRVAWILVLVLCAGLLAGCGEGNRKPQESSTPVNTGGAVVESPEVTPSDANALSDATNEEPSFRSVNLSEEAKQYYSRMTDSFLSMCARSDYRDLILSSSVALIDIDGDGLEELITYWEGKIEDPYKSDGLYADEHDTEVIFELTVYDYDELSDYKEIRFTQEKRDYFGYLQIDTFFLTDKGYLAYYTHSSDITQQPGWVYRSSQRETINGGIYMPGGEESAAYKNEYITQDEFKQICDDLGLVVREDTLQDGTLIVSYQPGEAVFPYDDTELDIATIFSWGYGDVRTDTPWSDIIAVAAGSTHTVGLKKDGTCVAVGNNAYGQCMVSEWTDIVAIAAGNNHTVGIKSDGTCVAAGSNNNGECNVTEWTNIVKVDARDRTTAGVRADGTCVFTGRDFEEVNLDGWTDIVDIACGWGHIIGVKSDGTVTVSGRLAFEVGTPNGKVFLDVNEVAQWTDIVQIIAESDHVIGLKSDGTAIATAVVVVDDHGQGDMSAMHDIVAIDSSWDYTVGLKKDGTLELAGRSPGRASNEAATALFESSTFISVSAGGHLVGLRKDGTVVALGVNGDGQIDMAVKP